MSFVKSYGIKNMQESFPFFVMLRKDSGMMVYRFLILHAESQRFFIQLDRHPRTPNLLKLGFAGYLAADGYVGLRIDAIPDRILTVYMLHLGKVDALKCAPIIPAKTPRGSCHQF